MQTINDSLTVTGTLTTNSGLNVTTLTAQSIVDGNSLSEKYLYIKNKKILGEMSDI